MRTLSKLASLMSLQAFILMGCAADGEPNAADEDEGVVLAQQAAAGGGVDLTGTWFARVKTSVKITAPLIGASTAPSELAIKLFVQRANGTLNIAAQICKLQTDSANLKIDYVKVLPYMKVAASEPDFEAAIGAKVPLPTLNFRIGIDAAGASVDVDGDKNAGGTLPIVALGLLGINSYTGLNLSIAMDATLKAADLIEGTSNFAGSGKIFGSNNPLLTAGEFVVEQMTNPTTFTSKRLAGDVSCADLLKQP